MLRLDGLYDLHDMRESELDALNEAIAPAVHAVRDEAHRMLIEAIVQVGVRFAAEQPDVPGRQQLAPA